MAVLEEVVTEMFRQEQEALGFERGLCGEQGGPDMVGSVSYQELEFEEVVDEGIVGIRCETSSDSAYNGLTSHHEEEDDEEFDDGEFDDLTIPYEGSSEDDDGGFFSDIDPRFIDYGWDAECLQHTEDIDFEFVYALHTFVATVEGQANATKGDTMVLLDDSNSYWWLVRVVKDSSIGECLSLSDRPCWLLTGGFARLPTGRAYRDPHRETGQVKQASEYRRRLLDKYESERG
jgi:hypothetical protein